MQVGEGVALHFYGSQAPVRVKIGITTAQDLTCDLGPPLRVHHREDDRMTIHLTNRQDPDIDTGCEFARSIDVLCPYFCRLLQLLPARS